MGAASAIGFGPAPAITGNGVSPAVAAKARTAAQDFEAVFLNSMFQQMFSEVKGERPFGSTAGTGPWRSVLTEEYAKNVSRAGGIGLADHVYRALITQQEKKTWECAIFASFKAGDVASGAIQAEIEVM